MKKPSLNVFAGQDPVGTLTRSDVEEDTIVFGYREGCPAENAVSLTMPIRVDQYDAMGGLLPVFEMNLPEGALKERLRLQFAKTIREFDDLDLLHIVGSSQIGRLRYSQQPQVDVAVPEQDIDEIPTYKGTMDDSKRFPDRARLIKFVRFVTGKTERAANTLLEQVRVGVETALDRAADYGRQHKDAAQFLERMMQVMREGQARLN